MRHEDKAGLIKECINQNMQQDKPASVEPATGTGGISKDSLPFIVLERLSIGKENAISTQVLCDSLGFDSPRELQLEIARERKAGAVILSTCQDGGGYFLPENDHEIKQFMRTLENRAKNTFVALKSARRLLGQQEDTRDK